MQQLSTLPGFCSGSLETCPASHSSTHCYWERNTHVKRCLSSDTSLSLSCTTVTGRTTQGNYTPDCKKRQCSVSTFQWGCWARTCSRLGGWIPALRADQSAVTAGERLRDAMLQTGQPPQSINTLPANSHTANPDVDSMLSIQRSPSPETHPCEGLPAQPEGKWIKAKALCK